MQPHEQRVVDEKAELDEKISKLETFLSSDFYETLKRTSKELLVLQYAYMKNYSDILEQRIKLF